MSSSSRAWGASFSRRPRSPPVLAQLGLDVSRSRVSNRSFSLRMARAAFRELVLVQAHARSSARERTGRCGRRCREVVEGEGELLRRDKSEIHREPERSRTEVLVSPLPMRSAVGRSVRNFFVTCRASGWRRGDPRPSPSRASASSCHRPRRLRPERSREPTRSSSASGRTSPRDGAPRLSKMAIPRGSSSRTARRSP